jgi:uroporphyrinogen decarboxylase
MSQTPREIVRRALTFDHPERLPRDLWLLPWAEIHYPQEVAALVKRYPPDFTRPPDVYRPSAVRRGDPYAAGEFVDEWGCTFLNIQAGIIGEVRRPLLTDPADWESVMPPTDTLPEDKSGAYETIRQFCESSDRFVMAPCCPRPWERYQFLRGSADALTDLLLAPDEVRRLLQTIHEFYLRELDFWMKSEVDGFSISDDWGTQRQLFIDLGLWRELFRPLYRDYCELARAHGKFVFMHSDGWITDIIEDLIAIGVDALNSQLFCMDLDELSRRFKGRITFWGEIDRQHVLPSPDPESGREAVRRVASRLYHSAGGIIAQLELGLGANPATALAAYEEWERWDRAARPS